MSSQVQSIAITTKKSKFHQRKVIHFNKSEEKFVLKHRMYPPLKSRVIYELSLLCNFQFYNAKDQLYISKISGNIDSEYFLTQLKYKTVFIILPLLLKLGETF